MTYACVDNM